MLKNCRLPHAIVYTDASEFEEELNVIKLSARISLDCMTVPMYIHGEQMR